MTKVYIVEDEALIAAEIETYLEQLGYAVIGHAMNGDTAMDEIVNRKPDIILMDINIKGSRDGIELASIINKEYKIPFIFLTSFADKHTIERAKLTMPYGYIVKPFTQNDIATNLEMALFRHSNENQSLFPNKITLENKLSLDFSDRQYELFQSLFEGLTYKEIGEKHFISVNTVKSYLKSLFLKLQVSSRHEAIQIILNLK